MPNRLIVDHFVRRRLSHRHLTGAALICLALALPGCWNGSYNQDVGAEGGRFELTIEPSRTDVRGTHFLVDSATGDLWHLEANGATASWARLANAPEDAAVLEPRESEMPTDD
jgi:hypothetical protein